MNVRTTTMRLMLMACFPCLAVMGCKETPPTNADEVLDYVRNASVGAQVRRLDPEAQEYVNGVMKAYREWKAKWDNSIAAIQKINPLQNDEPVSAEESLKHMSDMQARMAEMSSQQAIAPLTEAILSVPDLPGGLSTRDGPLRNAVSALLIYPGRDSPAIESLAKDQVAAFQHYNELMASCTERVRSSTAPDDPRGFSTEIMSCMNDARRGARKDSIVASISRLESKLEEHIKARTDTVAEKQDVRKTGLEDLNNIRRYRALEMKVHYHDAIVSSSEKELRKAKTELDKLENPKESETESKDDDAS